MKSQFQSPKISRRTFLASGALATSLSSFPKPLFARQRPLKIGFITPETGPLSVFSAANEFVLKGVRYALANGLTFGGKKREVEILIRDSGSSSGKAASLAAELIENEHINLMLAMATPDTTNPVADQCEISDIPCLSTAAPWEAWYFGRGGTPDSGFKYTFHFFFGLENILSAYAAVWNRLQTNKLVGGLFPNDEDGDAWSHEKFGAPGLLPDLGYSLTKLDSFENSNDDFSMQIASAKKAGVQIVTGVLNPPDWIRFWHQANEQKLHLKAATVAKALVFPSAIQALGPLADGLTMEVVWAPNFPFSSSLTRKNAKTLADEWTRSTNSFWTPSLGWTHALYEVGMDALARAEDPDEPDSVAAALAATNIQTVMGNINFSKGPFGRNVSITPLVSGQWKLGGQFGIDLDIISNEFLPQVPLTADLRSISA